jgi:hypothetical protein
MSAELLDQVTRDASGRPTFYARQAGRTLPIRAAGFTMFAWIAGAWYVLLMQTRPNIDVLEDLGGKTDPLDRDLTVIAAREVDEESNFIWFWKDLLYMALVRDFYVGMYFLSGLLYNGKERRPDGALRYEEMDPCPGHHVAQETRV